MKFISKILNLLPVQRKVGVHHFRILKKQDDTGVPVKTVKSFMSKIPSVFTGQDLISWMLNNLDLSDCSEALMLANRMAASGYFFPIDDHVLQVKNDNTYYRFQV